MFIFGVELTTKQEEILREGGIIFVENMVHPNDKTKFSTYAFTNDNKDNISFSNKNPEGFIKYGKYEMRLRDKILIEKGFVTKAKVKWFGGIDFQYPYLWKENKSDTEYKESWSDPRLPKTQKEKMNPKSPIIQKRNKGKRMS